MPAALETHHLTRRFGRSVAVDDVSMTVPEQAIYGFLGRNGAGKTTTLKMLLGLLKPTAGQARVCGVDVARNRIAAARNIGALLDAHGFYANLSGRENLELTRRLLGASTTEIDRVLEVVEMTPNAGRRVSDYSLGMRQRLGLARAMIGAPAVMVLDEPTNGLDPDGIADMRRLLRDLPGRTGATVLLSSHLLGEIEQTASHVGMLNNGRLVMEGRLAALRATSAPEVAVETDDPARAHALASARGFDVETTHDGLVARLKRGEDGRAAAAVLNRALVEAGIAVFGVAARAPSLEGLYRRLKTETQMETA